MEILALLCILVAIILLIVLAVIDFKTFLLPNVFVFPFAVLGPIFHLLTDFYHLTLSQVIIGGVAGYALLYAIRWAGNKYYGQDSLGLGDVKLLGASGLWLGLDGVLFAMTAGAFVGLLHGLVFATYQKFKTKQPLSLSRLTIPAGPGFVVGILGTGAWLYEGFIIQSFHSVIP